MTMEIWEEAAVGGSVGGGVPSQGGVKICQREGGSQSADREEMPRVPLGDAR
jgi:hypothetical protein